jgi:hypothetical protein
MRKTALTRSGAATMSPIKGRVIRLKAATNAPSTRRTAPALKLESLSARQDLALMGFLLTSALPGIFASAEAAAIVAAPLAAEAVPAGVFFRSGRAGLRNIYLAAQSWNLDKRHAALLLYPYAEF